MRNTHVVAAELGAGVAALEGVQRSSLSVLALSKGELRELSCSDSVQDTHARLQVPLLVLVGHDPLMHDTRIIELPKSALIKQTTQVKPTSAARSGSLGISLANDAAARAETARVNLMLTVVTR